MTRKRKPRTEIQVYQGKVDEEIKPICQPLHTQEEGDAITEGAGMIGRSLFQMAARYLLGGQ